MRALGSANIDCRQDGVALDPDARPRELSLQPDLAGIEAADAILIVGSNPRQEAAGAQRAHPQALAPRRRCRSALIGEQADLTYDYDYLGAGPESLSRRSPAKASFFEKLKSAKRPMIIVGQGALRGPTAPPCSPPRRGSPPMSARCSEGWNGLCGAAHRRLARRRARSRLRAGRGRALGTRHGRRHDAKSASTSCSCSAPTRSTCSAGRRFVVYHRHAWRRRRAPRRRHPPRRRLHREVRDLREHRGPRAARNRAAFPPGDAREDWAILRALSDVLGRALPFDSPGALRARDLCGASASCRGSTHIMRPMPADFAALAGARRSIVRRGLRQPRSRDFYLTNPIARASAVMAECSRLHLGPAARGGGVGGDERLRQRLRAPRHPHRRCRACCCMVVAADLRGLPALRRPQGLGGRAAAPRAERRRALGPAAVLRRSPQIRAEGAGHPGAAPTRASSCSRRSSARCSRSPPGRSSRSRPAGSSPTSMSASSTSSPSPRSASTASSWAAGRRTRNTRSSARSARRRRWSPTKSRSASSSSPCCSASARSISPTSCWRRPRASAP